MAFWQHCGDTELCHNRPGDGSIASVQIYFWPIYDDVMAWKRIPEKTTLCEGNPLATGGFPSQKASNVELWLFLCCDLEQTVEQTVELQETWEPCRSCTVTVMTPFFSSGWRTLPSFVIENRELSRSNFVVTDRTGSWQQPSLLPVTKFTAMSIDPSHKSQNASVPYPTMHHFVTEICTFLLQNGALWDICLMHCGICEMDLFSGMTLVWQRYYSMTIILPCLVIALFIIARHRIKRDNDKI